jgi:hypothetical protein
MTFKRLLGIAMSLCAVTVLVGSVGAGAARTPAKRAIDVSTNSAVKKYLRSHGISARRVVIQRGSKNYAGPRCPGKRWTCARTTHTVVQIASRGGKNTFACASASCAVVQVAAAPAAPNIAKCIRTTGITQSCSINQSSTSAENQAIIVEIATKTSGLTQNASQTAQIVQSAGSGANSACVLQRARIEGSTAVNKKGVPVNVNLDAHQTLSVQQDSLSGGNTLKGSTESGGCMSAPPYAEQSQAIVSNASGSATINQNLDRIDSGPNMVADIQQNQHSGFTNSGQNTALLNQTNILGTVAIGPGPSVQQKLGTTNGGLEGTVKQFSHNPPPSSLVNTSDVNQEEIQCVHAQVSGNASYPLPQPPFPPATKPACPSGGTQPAGLVQEQHGPMRKGPCCSVQGDNAGDTFTIGQDSFQDSDGNATQTNLIQGECTTSGNCTDTQNTNIDGQQSTNTQSGQQVNAQTSCSGSSCTTFTVNGPQLSATNTNVGEFGFGGMRGDGTGTITVSGIAGPVARALLYWNGPTNSSDPSANANVTFNGSPVTGTNTGFSGDNCWGFQNSQSYQADVTALLNAPDANGTYSLSNFNKPPDVEINGVSLVVFYNDTDPSNDRNVTLWSGNDSNVASAFDPEGWDQTITGVQYPGSGSARLDFIVSDGQTADDGALVVNGTTVVPTGPIFSGDSTPHGGFDAAGDLWDVKSFDITGLGILSPGSNDLHLTSGLANDCLSLVGFAANVPASAPPIQSPASAVMQPAATQARATAPAQAASGGSTGRGGVIGR